MSSKTRTLQIRVTEDLFSEIDAACQAEGIDRSSWSRNAIQQKLDLHNREKAAYKSVLEIGLIKIQLLLESDEYHQCELQREAKRLLCQINL